MKVIFFSMAIFCVTCFGQEVENGGNEFRVELLTRHEGELTVKSHAIKPGESVEIVVGSVQNGKVFHGVSFKVETAEAEKADEVLITAVFERYEKGVLVQSDRQRFPLVPDQWLHERVKVSLKDIPYSYRIVR